MSNNEYFLEEYKRIIKDKKCLESLLIIVFFVQFLTISYFNLKLIESHIGFDSSWYFLKTALIWNEKSINSTIWEDMGTAALDSSVIMAAPLYGITGKLLPSYGFVNVVVIVLALLCLSSILRLLNIDLKARLFAYNLVICPYLTNVREWINNLGYFSNILGDAAFYNLRTVIILLVIREFLFVRKNRKIDVLGYITLTLCFFTGVSSGIYIIAMLFLPYLLFIMEQIFFNNDIKYLSKPESIFAYLGIVFVVTGKLIGNSILGIQAIDNTRTWTPLTKIFTNFGAPLQGFMKLLCVLPVEDTAVKILSIEGLYQFFPLFIFVIIIISIGYSTKMVYRNILAENGNLLFLVNIIAVNYIMFGLFNVQYGSALFEERYLVPTFMIVIMLVAYYLHNTKTDLIFTKVIMFVLLVSLVGNNYVSDRNYIKTTNDHKQMAEIKAIVDSKNAKIVYFWGDKFNVIGWIMRVYDMNHVYKVIRDDGYFLHWGDYKYLDDISDYSNNTILITSSESEKNIPQYIMDSYSLLKKFNSMSVYKSESNPVDGIAGITGTVSIDFPSTFGFHTSNGRFEGRSFISDGTPGFIMWGPYCKTVDGEFDFILDYEIIEGKGAFFDVAIDSGEKQLGSVKLDPLHKEMKLSGISLRAGHTLEYRVFCEAGTKIKIKKITIKKNS